MTLYLPGVNPAVSLYNLWLSLLSMQQVIDVKALAHLQSSEARISMGAWNANQAFARVGYGDSHTGIGVWGFDAQQRPILQYGGWYGPQQGIYTYLVLDADGNFRLIHPHGDNHNRLERHTFLGWGTHGGQYVWWVSPTHASSQWLNTQDFRTRVPYYRERVLTGRTTGWRDRYRAWCRLIDLGDGIWDIAPVEPNTEFGMAMLADKARTERAYRKQERKAGVSRTLSVRDGKTTLHTDAAVLHIAALLDVSQPARAVRMTRHSAEEARV